MKAEVTTINETTHRLSLTGFTGELHENIRLDYDFALRRDADRFCKMINSSLSSKITAIKEKFGFTYYRTKYPTDIALILEIERDQILNELEG